MDLNEGSDNTQSEYDEIVSEMIDSSDNDDRKTVREISQNETFSTIATSATSESLNSSSAAQNFINPSRIAAYPGMNGLNINPIYYTDPQSAAFIVDNRNIGNYEEISTYSSFPYPVQSSLFSEIPHTAAPSNHDINNYASPSVRSSAVPISSSDVTNINLAESVESTQKTITVMQNATATITHGQSVQKVKKRGRKRLNDNAKRATEMVNLMPEDSIPKKRGRKRKDDRYNVGKEHEKPYQSISNANMKANVDKNQQNTVEKNSEISTNQSLNAITGVKNTDEEEKRAKKRSRKKTRSESDNAKIATKKQCMEEMLLKQKSRMAFPKGTFLIRYCDLETLDCDQIWCVDNHHMLLKYRLSSHIEGKRRLYLKSQPERFVGWKCEEPWHFHELTVLERDRDSSKVLILYPDVKELAECREKARRQKQIEEEKKRSLDNSLNSASTKQNFGATAARTMIQNDGTVMNEEEQSSQQQQNLEAQMIDEAANAIERFILIPENDYSETDEEYMVKTATVIENFNEEHTAESE